MCLGEHVADELLRKGIESVAVTCDVTKVEQFQHCMDNIIERWGKVDIAVNNAGVTLSSDAEDTSEVYIFCLLPFIGILTVF